MDAIDKLEQFFKKVIEILRAKVKADPNFLSKDVPMLKGGGSQKIGFILTHAFCQWLAFELKAQGILTEAEFNELKKLFPA